MVGHVPTNSQIRNAQRRVDRFISEHGDDLLKISKKHQAEVLEDAYQGRGSMARTKLRMYSRELHAVRSEASVKAAQTKLRKRQGQTGMRIRRIFANASRNRVMKNVQTFTPTQLHNLERMSDNDFQSYVITEARAASKSGAVLSPFFYR